MISSIQVYKDINNKLKTSLYKKSPDCQTIYTQTRTPVHPRSLNESIAYREALRDKRIYFTNFESDTQINTIKDQLGYGKPQVENQIEKVEKIDWSGLLKEQNASKKASCFPVSATYNRKFPNKKYTSAALAPVKNRPNICGNTSTNPNTSIS